MSYLNPIGITNLLQILQATGQSGYLIILHHSLTQYKDNLFF